MSPSRQHVHHEGRHLNRLRSAGPIGPVLLSLPLSLSFLPPNFFEVCARRRAPADSAGICSRRIGSISVPCYCLRCSFLSTCRTCTCLHPLLCIRAEGTGSLARDLISLVSPSANASLGKERISPFAIFEYYSADEHFPVSEGLREASGVVPDVVVVVDRFDQLQVQEGVCGES